MGVCAWFYFFFVVSTYFTITPDPPPRQFSVGVVLASERAVYGIILLIWNLRTPLDWKRMSS